MKINCIGSELQTIKNGACFIYDDVPYIKTNTEEELPDHDFIKIMVVDLEDGTVDYLFSDTLVIPIDAEIRINGN